ncbi:STAS domain-containing protein [Streptomyces sp. NBC_00161]|uniref:STAS domain-containing protein n=1 Tax=Streptomyces sp. NBC_00161 TaxID=2975671 RepID=UPI003244A058
MRVTPGERRASPGTVVFRADDVTLITTRADDRLTVAVLGEIDIATAPLLSQALHAALADGVSRVVADFRGVTFCDVSGLNALLRARRAARARGHSLHVTEVTSPQVRKLFEMTGTTEMISPPAAPTLRHSATPTPSSGASDALGGGTLDRLTGASGPGRPHLTPAPARRPGHPRTRRG